MLRSGHPLALLVHDSEPPPPPPIGEMRDARARPRTPPPAIPSVPRRSPRLARPPPPASPSGPRVLRRSPRLARPPPVTASSAASSSCRRRRRGTQHATDPERPPPALTSDIHEEIFLRVSSPKDLARASFACVAFRRIIADHDFLRRYRTIHPPLLLGFVSSDGFHPTEAPHPSAAVSRAVAALSFDYLPPTTSSYPWHVCDVHDGRVLFKRGHRDHLVCDPLSRRYRLLPPITNLLASIGMQNQHIIRKGSSFIRSGGIEEDTSFRVINWIQSSSRLGVFIFSSGSGCWSVNTSIGWGDLGLDALDMLVSSQCAYNCIYWQLFDDRRMVKLDLNSMQFSTIRLPPGPLLRRMVVVESEESRVAMFGTMYGDTSVDYYTFSQNGSEKSHEWHFESTIPLPAHYICEANIARPAEGYIFIQCSSDEEDRPYSTFFSLEIKSLNIEKVGRTPSNDCYYPYFGFPPSMSPRRI